MRGTQSTDAFELFKAGVRARALPLTQERWEQSHKSFQEAIAVDTGGSFENAKKERKGYARAWSWMAYGVALSYHEGWQGETAKAEAIDYAKISVEVRQVRLRQPLGRRFRAPAKRRHGQGGRTYE